MHQIRLIIQLLARGSSHRQIAREAQVHRKVVGDYITRCEHSGKTYAELLALTDDSLWSLLYPISGLAVPLDIRFKDFQERLSYFQTELKRPGVTRQLLWKEYQRAYPTGYCYTQFCEYLRRDLATRQATMHFEHKAGACVMMTLRVKNFRISTLKRVNSYPMMY
jgi:hypothetical protein